MGLFVRFYEHRMRYNRYRVHIIRVNIIDRRYAVLTIGSIGRPVKKEKKTVYTSKDGR